MLDIPTNNPKNENVEKVVAKIVETLKSQTCAQVTRSEINKEEAKQIANLFYEKGYHHEIRMHTNNYGAVFFYCLNISKNPIRTDDARFAWSVYVR